MGVPLRLLTRLLVHFVSSALVSCGDEAPSLIMKLLDGPTGLRPVDVRVESSISIIDQDVVFVKCINVVGQAVLPRDWEGRKASG
jgi:hypothetical protein